MSTPLFHHVLAEDDINQVLKLVKNSPGSNICFLIDEANHIFRNEINLRLLRSYMKEFSVEVCFITADKGIIVNAYDHGILSYDNKMEAFDRNKAINPKYIVAPSPSVKSGINKVVPIVGIAILGLAVIGFLFSPKVYIEITPAYQEHILLVSYNETLEKIQETIEVQAVVPSTGSKSVGVDHATGSVTFINESRQSVLVSAGTVVETLTGLQFTTDSSITVPPQEITYFLDAPVGTIAGRGEVRVTAVHPGTSSNVGEGSIRVVKLDNASLIVRNSQPLTGGTDKQINAVTEYDWESVKTLANTLLEKEIADLVQERKDTLKDQVLVGLNKLQLTTETNLEVEDIGDELIVDLQAVLEMYWVPKKALNNQVNKSVGKSLSSGYKWEKGADYLVELIDYDVENEEIELQVKVMISPLVDRVQIAKTVAGLPLEEGINSILQEQPFTKVTVADPKPQFFPRWAPWIGVKEVVFSNAVHEVSVRDE